MDAQQVAGLYPRRLIFRLIQRGATADHLFVVLVPNYPLAFLLLQNRNGNLFKHG
jgi:hypothetical protein